MNTQILSIFVIGFLVASFIFATNPASAQLQLSPNQDRYALECGVQLSVSPETYIANMLKQFNYDLSSMPKFLYDTYICVNTINLQDEAGTIESGNIFDKFD